MPPAPPGCSSRPPSARRGPLSPTCRPAIGRPWCPTRPLVGTAAFSLQLFLAGLEEGLWTLPQPTAAGQARPLSAPDDDWSWARHPGATPVVAYGTDAAGLEPIVACRTTHAALDAFLA